MTEVGTNPAEFSLTSNEDQYWEITSYELGLFLYLSRGLGISGKFDTVYIEFAVNGKYNITGGGNAIKVFSTVKAMLEKYLRGFLERTDVVVQFASERNEPSRIKLYNRAVPVISSILGSNWQYQTEQETWNSLHTYVWKKKVELKEKQVQSTWITDLVHNRPNKYIIMRLSNGRQFKIPGMTRTTFERWFNAPSKGVFFHENIKGKFQISRIK